MIIQICPWQRQPTPKLSRCLLPHGVTLAGWTDAVHFHDGVQVDITEEIEGMDITELKARLLRDNLEQHHREHEYRPPPRESPMYGRPLTISTLACRSIRCSDLRLTERIPHYAACQWTALSQDQGQDHIATPGHISQQQLYDMHAYKLEFALSALEEAAKEAAATKKVSEEKILGRNAPIMFHDAYQRAYKLPFHLCEK